MRRSLLVALLLSSIAWPVAPAAAPAANDVRVLIDISGSMRQNDPDNLRRPALRMLVGLLQPGTEAGVWTFARWVNMLVPHGPVDAAWKKRAISLSEQIASPGQFTNIEEVLERATRSWSGSTAAGQRHLVLLTDGMVDVGKDPALNQASRARILDELLPRIHAAGGRIHAIALSDRADHDLLRDLAAATDGWYQQVDAAADLQRVFLRIFDKVGQPEGVPLEGNRFQVDRSIDEATVLVFREPGAAPTRLHAPDGSVYEGSDLTAGVAWFQDQGYDLITVARPAPGEWRLEAEADPDNRVMIVTDLKLQVAEVPGLLATGEAVPVSAHLANRGELVERRAFLDLVQMQAGAGPGDDRLADLGINDAGTAADAQAGDGRYGARLEAPAEGGELVLRLRAESNTFVREKRVLLQVTEPLELAVAGEGAAATARLVVDDTVLPEVATVTLWQEGPQGERRDLQPDPGEGAWSAPLAEAGWAVLGRVAGTTRAGNGYARDLGPVYPPGVGPPPEPVVAPPNAPAPAAAETPVGEPAAPAPLDEPLAAEDAGGWGLPVLAFAALNLVLLLGGGAAWWSLRRRRRPDQGVVLVEDEAPAVAGDQATDITRGEAA